MADLLNEFDEKRYPFRYRMNVGDRGGSRLRLYLVNAAEKLGLDMGLSVRHNGQHDPNHERRNTFDIGIGLTHEKDYALLMAELDQMSLVKLSKLDLDCAEHEGARSELLEAYAEQVHDAAENHEKDLSDFGLEL